MLLSIIVAQEGESHLFTNALLICNLISLSFQALRSAVLTYAHLFNKLKEFLVKFKASTKVMSLNHSKVIQMFGFKATLFEYKR